MKYPKVYELLVQRGAWDDPPDTDEIIAAALDVARAAVVEIQEDSAFVRANDVLDAINALRGDRG